MVHQRNTFALKIARILTEQHHAYVCQSSIDPQNTCRLFVYITHLQERISFAHNRYVKYDVAVVWQAFCCFLGAAAVPCCRSHAEERSSPRPTCWAACLVKPIIKPSCMTFSSENGMWKYTLG